MSSLRFAMVGVDGKLTVDQMPPGVGLTQANILDLIGAANVDTAAPTTPTAVALATVSGGGSVRLTWTANTEPDFYRYEYRLDTASPPTTAWVPVSRTLTSLQVTGLTNGVTVYAQMRAVDVSGNYSPASAIISTTPDNALFSATFTAANGSPVPAAFTPYPYSGATFDIQNNRLRMLGPSSSYADGGRIFLDNSANGAPPQYGDWDLTVDAACSSTGNDGSLILVVRHGETNGGYYQTPYNGYLLIIKSSGYSLQKMSANTLTNLSGNLALVQSAAGVLNRYRLRIVGSALSVKTWAPGASEPTSWAWTGTDTSLSGTSVLYFGQGNGSSSSIEFTVDNLRIVTP